MSVSMEVLNEYRRDIRVAEQRFSVREVLRMVDEERIDIAPSYQRRFRWSPETSSEFVESLLLGLPIPAIFVATNEGFRWEVVDGQQRLGTLVHFAGDPTDLFPQIAEPLTLTGLGRLRELNGYTYERLPEDIKAYLDIQSLGVVVLTDMSDPEVRYDLFERLNKGSVPLTNQEIRSCVFRGAFNDLIQELASEESFKNLVVLRRSDQGKGIEEEQVLKYFAYSDSDFRANFNGQVSSRLNSFMRAKSDLDAAEVESMKRDFRAAVATLRWATGGQQYARTDYRMTPLAQFESSLVAAGELARAGARVAVDEPSWLDDTVLKSSSMGGTNTRRMLEARIARSRALMAGEAQPEFDD